MQKGFVPIIILIGALVIAAVAGGFYYFETKNSQLTPAPVSSTFISYNLSGGIAGIDENLTINTSGQAIITKNAGTRIFTPVTFVVDQNDMQSLSKQLEASNFTHLQSTYFPNKGGNDLQTYTITYHGHTVKTMDTAVPSQLSQIITILNNIIQLGTSTNLQ